MGNLPNCVVMGRIWAENNLNTRGAYIYFAIVYNFLKPKNSLNLGER